MIRYSSSGHPTVIRLLPILQMTTPLILLFVILTTFTTATLFQQTLFQQDDITKTASNDSLTWQEPRVFVYVHPWGQNDEFLSIDCMIRSTQFYPEDTYTIAIKQRAPTIQTSSDSQLQLPPKNYPNNNIGKNNIELYQDLDTTPEQEKKEKGEDIFQSYRSFTTTTPNFFDPDQQTPFTKVYTTPFTSGLQCSPVSTFPVSPSDTRLDLVPIPFPTDPNSPLKDTENWINFRWVSDDAEIHELLRFDVEFLYNTINPINRQPVIVKQTGVIIQKLALAKSIFLQNFRQSSQSFRNNNKLGRGAGSDGDDGDDGDDLSVRNEFIIHFEKVDYKLRSLMIALHGNHFFDGNFLTCKINDVVINSAYQLDVGVNLTVTDTPMGIQPSGTYDLVCNDATIGSNNQTSFGLQTVLSISGQPDSFWDDNTLYPAIGYVIDGLKYELRPDYTAYWISIIILFISSSIVSVVILKCWSLDDKHVMVM